MDLSVGLVLPAVHDLAQALETASASGFQYICTPLFHPRYRRGLQRWRSREHRNEPMTRSDEVVGSASWTTLVVGMLSSWIDLDAESAAARAMAEAAWEEEFRWAVHLSVPAVIVDGLSPCSANLARALSTQLASAQRTEVWVRVPLVSRLDELRERRRVHSAPANEHAKGKRGREGEGEGEGGEGGEGFGDEPWRQWNVLRGLLEQNPLVGVVLELTESLPSDSCLDRWLGEPVRAVIVPSTVFTTTAPPSPDPADQRSRVGHDNHAQPPPPPPLPRVTLSPRHAEVVRKLFRFPKIHWAVQGRPDGEEASDCLDCLRGLWAERAPASEQQRMEDPYADLLQAPLQPLQDNLESQTYEVFEKDPVKYVNYENAVMKAILDKQPLPVTERDADGGAAHPKALVVMVLGAGRGPLVRASLRAARRAERRIRVFAVEKNPNAVCTLRNAHRTLGWGKQVTIVHSDMREWQAPELADIVVSELLGSFGDNELSPECLDGANRFLKPDAVSVPANYTSYLAPLSTSKLWNDVSAMGAVSAGGSLKSLETPYVVNMHNVFRVAAPEPCFRFDHPNRAPVINNERYARLQWVASEAATVHGLAGYFHSQLYADEAISIEPSTFSTGMFSWFPLYFPFRTPFEVQKGGVVEVHVWRRCSSRQVWYEWCATKPVVTPIHNPNGRSYHIGL